MFRFGNIAEELKLITWLVIGIYIYLFTFIVKKYSFWKHCILAIGNMRLSAEEYEQWLKRRRRTVVVFTMETILIGMDFSLTMLTMLLYIKELVKPKSPLSIYSLALTAYLLGSLIGPGILGRIVDRHRNIRKTFFICNTLVIIGNLIYTLHYSPWLIIAGRMLAGMAGPLRPVISGELARCYTPDELTGKLSIMGTAYTFGFVAGPVVNLLCKDVDLSIYTWKLTFVNLPGICMAALFLIAQIINLFFLSDLSKIFDLKRETVQSNSNEEGEVNNSEGTLGVFAATKEILFEFDAVLILLLAFFENYFTNSYDIWMIQLVVNKMKWSVSALNGIAFGRGVSCMLHCMILIFVSISNRQIFHMAIASFLSMVIMTGVYMFMFCYDDNTALDIFLWVIYCLLHGVVTLVEEVFFVGVMAKLVSSSMQTFADSIRLSAYRLGALIAFSTSAFAFSSLAEVGTIHIVIMVALVLLLIARRKTIQNPQIVIFGR